MISRAHESHHDHTQLRKASPMRDLIVTTFLSADGVMDSPGGGDHPAAGWTFRDVE